MVTLFVLSVMTSGVPLRRVLIPVFDGSFLLEASATSATTQGSVIERAVRKHRLLRPWDGRLVLSS